MQCWHSHRQADDVSQQMTPWIREGEGARVHDARHHTTATVILWLC